MKIERDSEHPHYIVTEPGWDIVSFPNLISFTRATLRPLAFMRNRFRTGCIDDGGHGGKRKPVPMERRSMSFNSKPTPTVPSAA